MSFDKEFAFGEQFIPAIKTILAERMIEVASVTIDAAMATDLLLMNATNLAIAVRMRRMKYFSSFGKEFTIRSKTDNFPVTELDKIMTGWGDWMFYGFGEEGRVMRWALLDLEAFRWNRSVKPFVEDRSNYDGTYFNSYRFSDFDNGGPPLIIGSNHVQSTYDLFSEAL